MSEPLTAEELLAHYREVRQRLGVQRVYTPVVIKKPICDVPKDLAMQVVTSSATCRKLLRNSILDERHKPREKRQIDIVKNETAERHDLPYNFHQNFLRVPKYIEARADFYYRAMQEGYTLSSIARYCLKDHTTVLHSVKKYARKNGLPYPPPKTRG